MYYAVKGTILNYGIGDHEEISRRGSHERMSDDHTEVVREAVKSILETKITKPGNSH